ncbi:histone-lysine N-methyltransferase SETD1A [Mangifera indica]|uniref:histone-lysine N-methyltransferase SETD1A n=1 Tax=Mangifera indica TaxID=29780 RepID=UPI001CF9354E|nr:histone-lysine N-methyltransferase SETD1A [Mangifera indica]
MGSRDKDQTTPYHQPLLSSLVVRPSVSDGGGDGGGGRGGGSDYEPGEVRRDPPPTYRSDRYPDEPGYRTRAGSVSPVRRRDADHRYGSNFDHSGGMLRSREFGSGKDHGRYRDPSPPYSRGRGAGRPFGRGFDGPAPGPGPLRGEGMNRNNPNVRPREGDWICPDPACGNLNFARREYCNNCKRFRYAPGGSPRRGYPGPPPPPPPPPRRFLAPPVDISPGNGYRSPPRGWGRDGHGPREFGAGGPPPSRHEGRFSDHMRRDQLDFPDDGYRGRNKPMLPMDWGHRDRGRDNFNERKRYDRRVPSPPPVAPVPPHRGRWGRDVRERSRSPIRGAPPPKDYRRDMYMERGRDDHRRGGGRDRIGDAY